MTIEEKQVDWFDSPYFDRYSNERVGKALARFLENICSKLQLVSGSPALHVGCGNGSVTRLLERCDIEVTGIDQTPQQISRAIEHSSETMQFFLHDLRLPFWINYFQSAFILDSYFGFYRTEREHYNAVRTVASSLRPGGILVIDYLNVHFEEDNLQYRNDFDIGNVSYQTTNWMDETHFYHKFSIEDEEQQEPLEFIEKKTKLSLGDFNDMLAFHELQVQQVFGDYELGNYDVRKSPRLIIVAKKSL